MMIIIGLGDETHEFSPTFSTSFNVILRRDLKSSRDAKQ